MIWTWSTLITGDSWVVWLGDIPCKVFCHLVFAWVCRFASTANFCDTAFVSSLIPHAEIFFTWAHFEETFAIIETVVISITVSISNGVAVPAESSVTDKWTQIGCPCCSLTFSSLPWKWRPCINSVNRSEPVIWHAWCWCMRLCVTSRSVDTTSGVNSTVMWSIAWLGWVTIMAWWYWVWDWERRTWWFWLVIIVVLVLFLLFVTEVIIVKVIVIVITTEVIVVVIIIVGWWEVSK